MIPWGHLTLFPFSLEVGSNPSESKSPDFYSQFSPHAGKITLSRLWSCEYYLLSLCYSTQYAYKYYRTHWYCRIPWNLEYELELRSYVLAPMPRTPIVCTGTDATYFWQWLYSWWVICFVKYKKRNNFSFNSLCVFCISQLKYIEKNVNVQHAA